MMHQPARGPRLRRLDPTFLLAFLLPVFAWAPLTYPGYFVFRSGFLPIFNLGDRLARPLDLAWAPTVGTGYHVLGGEGWLPYLLAGLPAALTGSPADAVKWTFGLAFVAGSAGAYLWARQRLRNGWPALAAAAVYVYGPGWLSVVYTGGAFALAVLLALLPWVLWAVGGAALGRRAALPLLALLAAACVWTQAALGIAFLAVAFAWLVVVIRKEVEPRHFVRAAIGLLAGLAVGALGWLPAVSARGFGAPAWSQGFQWLILAAPWLALVGGWIAARLDAMLPEQGDGERSALFACLIALVLLGAYPDVQPVASAGDIPAAPLAIFGDNEIALLSVEPEGTPGPGGRVALDVTWQALKPLAHDYTVFFHVMANNDKRYGQLDTMPQAGKLPTTQWRPGEVIRDRYEAVLGPAAPIDAPGGALYRYWLGWYLGETGERLAVTPGQDDKYVVTP